MELTVGVGGAGGGGGGASWVEGDFLIVFESDSLLWKVHFTIRGCRLTLSEGI